MDNNSILTAGVSVAKLIAIITFLVVFLQGFKKKILESPIGLWLFKKLFHIDEIPSWFITLITTAITVLTAILTALQDGVITTDEWITIIALIFGVPGTFDIVKKFETKNNNE